jgi:exosortase/archaeosortase family protein
MELDFLKKGSTFLLLLHFFLIAAGLYCLSLFLIGASAPGGKFYISWLHHVNYVYGLLTSISKTCAFILDLLGYNVTISNRSILQIENHTTIKLSFGCAGYGIMGIWTAFVLTLKQPFKSMFKGLLLGLIVLWSINVIRILLLILFNHHHFVHLLPFDHHTNFNIVSYLAILLMVRYYMKKTEHITE